jgi:hypothetical protein
MKRRCQACGYESLGLVGRCPRCGASLGPVVQGCDGCTPGWGCLAASGRSSSPKPGLLERAQKR